METPRGETEAKAPCGGRRLAVPASSLSLPQQAQGWALGTRPAESREEPHAHLLASLAEGGGETPLLSVFSPRRAVTPSPHFPGSQEENLGTSTEGSGPLRDLTVPQALAPQQTSCKVTFKKVCSVPGREGLDARAPSSSPREPQATFSVYEAMVGYRPQLLARSKRPCFWKLYRSTYSCFSGVTTELEPRG